jgi:predicted MPP superfamily phosphohydrolase|tara:strand:+ start:155 stop:289 length:135 start_codon:yes stop_codon:yes gene_type:complete
MATAQQTNEFLKGVQPLKGHTHGGQSILPQNVNLLDEAGERTLS